MRASTAFATLALCSACHSAVPDYAVNERNGAAGRQPDSTRLTFNDDQDHWPAYTQDGAGILYAYVPDDGSRIHRCLGLLPATGGTRLWQLCDNRGTQGDSTSSFTAYALDSAGRLLYVEAMAPLVPSTLLPTKATLWLAYTAAPFQRRSLLTLPLLLNGRQVNWMADLEWTGPQDFIAIADSMLPYPYEHGAAFDDSVFFGQGVVRGHIGPSGATLALITGTDGAVTYSLAAAGSIVVFTRRNSLQLFEVPASGGTATPVVTVTPNSSAQLFGVSCTSTTCVVAVASAHLIEALRPGQAETTAATVFAPFELRTVTLVPAEVSAVTTFDYFVATPKLSRDGRDVIVQRGGDLGHLQSNLTGAADLLLLKGFLR